jgi:hypothetical protein
MSRRIWCKVLVKVVAKGGKEKVAIWRYCQIPIKKNYNPAILPLLILLTASSAVVKRNGAKPRGERSEPVAKCLTA